MPLSALEHGLSVSHSFWVVCQEITRSAARARQAFGDAGGVAAPDLVDVETVAVLCKRWIAGTISGRRFATAVEDLEQLDLDRYPTIRFMRRACEHGQTSQRITRRT